MTASARRGPAGPQGPKGDDGDPGPQGDPGPAGPAGPQGSQGPRGFTGDTGPAGPTGPAGADGSTYDFQGAWQVGTTYSLNDVVQHEGSSFIALRTTVGDEPGASPADWDELALAGAVGPEGPVGPQGPQGAQGPQGIQGVKGDTGATGPAGSDATVPDADGSTKGKVQLAGDLAGTAAAPAVAKIRGKNVPAPGSSENGKAFVYDHTSGAMVWTDIATQAELDVEKARISSLEGGRGGVLDVVGHSYAGAGGATAGDQNGYVDRVAAQLGTRRRRNMAIGGAVSCWNVGGVTGDGGWGWVLSRPEFWAPAGAPYLPVVDKAIVDCAINDLATLGSTKPRPMQEGHRAIMSRLCAAAVLEETDSSFAYTGTWSNGNLGGYTSGSASQWKQTTTANDKVTWTAPADETNGLVKAIGLLVAPTDNIVLGLKVNGVSQPDITILGSAICDSAASKYNHAVLRFGRGGSSLSPLDFSGLPVAAGQAVELTLKTVTAGALRVDYAQVEADPLDGPVLIVPTPDRPYAYTLWTSWTHGPGAGTDPMNDAAVVTWQAAVAAVCAEFPGRTVQPDTDSVLAKARAVFSTADDAHLNNLGHGKYADAMMSALAASGLLTSRRQSRPAPIQRAYWTPVGADPVTGAKPGPAFTNSWTHMGSGQPPLSFHKDQRGRVFMRGSIKSGSSGSAAICTLPVGYRPETDMFVPGLASGGGTQWWQITPAGVVGIAVNGNTTQSTIAGEASWQAAA
jgi:collagen triple helix repeat protein/uncharacterized protein DUF5907